ncbi:MAG: hypothetical protein OCD02_06200 [Spirochaetaceae bacterium]
MKRFFQLVLIFTVSVNLWAQYDPSTNWKKLKTEHFNIVFDSRIENDAQKIANDMEFLYKSLTEDMGGTIDRYTIVLPADLVDSNGYVSSINNTSVFYSVPPIDAFAGSVEWYRILTIHETRHMAQYSNIRNSVLQKILEILFGSGGVLGAVLIPSYFYEGDAILSETLLTDYGRGRSPNFERSLRTILLNNKEYSFAKAFHGSNKDYYPNEYVLGYYLMTNLKKEFGFDILEKISSAAGNNPLPMNFSAAAAKETGKSIVSVYKDTMSELKQLWTEQDNKVKPTKTDVISLPKKVRFSNLKYPTIGSDGNLLYLEYHYDRDVAYKQFLVSQSTNDKVEHIALYGDFSEFNSNVIYSSFAYNSRWSYTEYSNIHKYNLNTKTNVTLTKKQRYFNPVYSKNGEIIAAIEHSTNRIVSIVLLDSESGNLIKKVELNNVDMVTGLSWGDNGNIAISAINSQGSFIGILEPDSTEITFITEPDNLERSFPILYEDKILFLTSYSGIENIHAIDLNTKEEFQLVSTRFGANYPEVKGDVLYFSSYGLDGYSITSLELKSSDWIPLDIIKQDHVDYFKPLVNDDKTPISEDQEFIEYNSEKYNPYTHLIDVHSWVLNPFIPVITNTDLYNAETETYFDTMELVLFSDDHLDYLSLIGYGHYKISTESWDFGLEAAFSGLYPEVTLDIDLYSDELGSGLTTLEVDFTSYIPFDFSTSSRATIYSIGISPYHYQDFSADYIYTKMYYFIDLSILDASGFELDIQLLFGHGIDIDEDNTLGLISEFQLPGFYGNQTLSITSEQKVNVEGYSSVTSSLLSLVDDSLLTLDLEETAFMSYQSLKYNTPFFYPDLSIFNWAYLTNFTFSAGYESIFSLDSDYNSLAFGEISMGYFLLRIPIELSTSFTYFYNIDAETWDYKFNPINFDYSI